MKPQFLIDEENKLLEKARRKDFDGVGRTSLIKIIDYQYRKEVRNKLIMKVSIALFCGSLIMAFLR